MSHLKGLALVRGFDLVDQPFMSSFGDGAPPRPMPRLAQQDSSALAAAGGAGGVTPVPTSERAEGTAAADEEEQDDLSWLWADDGDSS